jgi:hypothetical protein
MPNRSPEEPMPRLRQRWNREGRSACEAMRSAAQAAQS